MSKVDIRVRAVEIGHELVALDAALREAQIGFKNETGANSFAFYDTPLFRVLADRRDELRSALLILGGQWSAEGIAAILDGSGVPE